MRGSKGAVAEQAAEVVTRSNPVVDGPLLDAIGARSFRRAAVALARETPQTEGANEAARDAAQALLGLAAGADDAALRQLLRPDPEQDGTTWTVACYQIGDLTPCALLDFANPVDAVTSLGSCPELSHVAAELVASTPTGIRWTALIRTGQSVSFQLPDHRSASGATRDQPGESVLAAEHWRDQLRRWAAGSGDDDRAASHASAYRVTTSDPRQAVSSQHPIAPQPVERLGEETAVVHGADLERALALVIDALRALEVRTRGSAQPSGEILARLDALDRRMSDFQATVESTFERRIQALAGYSAELTRAFAAQQGAAMARVEARLDDLMARFPTPTAAVAAIELTTGSGQAPDRGGEPA